MKKELEGAINRFNLINKSKSQIADWEIIRKKLEESVKQSTLPTNNESFQLLRKRIKWYMSNQKDMPPFADTIDLVGSVAQQKNIS